MKLFRRAAIAASIAVCCLAAVGAASASAVTILNPGTVVGTAGTTNLIGSSGPTVTCTTSRVTDAVASDGTSVIALGNALFGGTCRESILGSSVTVRQTRPWTNRIIALSSGGNITGVQVDFILPADGVELSATGCSFEVQGTQSVLIPISTPAPLVTVSSLPFGTGPGGTTLGLVIRNPSGILCGFIGISDGVTARFSGTYALSPAVSGSL
jgi:hypothetical protein